MSRSQYLSEAVGIAQGQIKPLTRDRVQGMGSITHNDNTRTDLFSHRDSG